jgi:hypothetical protein
MRLCAGLLQIIRCLKDTVSKWGIGDSFFDHDIMLLSPRHSPDVMISSPGRAPFFADLQVLKRPDWADPAV